MRLRCRLRELRGERSLREMERLTGISRGSLSRWETGRELPADRYVAALEEHYGAPAATWFEAHVWLEVTTDDGDYPHRRFG